MANDMILLKAKAKQAGVEGYRTMSKAELEAAIKSAKGKGSTPAKGKAAASSNGASAAKGKGKTASSVAKGKTATASATKGKGKTAPAKSTARKTATPAKGKTAATGTAKRQSAASSKGKTGAKTTPAKAAAKVTQTRSRKNAPARAEIDRSKIDWKLETRVGASGKRKDVMDALRSKRGNYDKVFEVLQPNAKKYYPAKTKHEAERMLRWLINRVAFDYVMATGQHTPGARAGYGTSEKPQDVYRRTKREEARKEAEKAARAAKRGAPTKKQTGRKKAAPAKGKTSGRGKSAAKGKGKR